MKILIVLSSGFFSTYGGGQIYVKYIVDEMIRQNIFPHILMPNITGDSLDEYNGCKITTFKSITKYEELKDLVFHISPDIVHLHGYKAIFADVCATLKITCIVTAHHGGILCPAGSLLNYQNHICRLPANHTNCLPCVLRNTRLGIYFWPILKLLPVNLKLNFGTWIRVNYNLNYFAGVLLSHNIIQNKIEEWKIICDKATKIIAPSEAIASSMELNGCSKEKIIIIPHGIPTPTIQKDNSQCNRDDNSKIKFYYLGRISYIKGLHIMLAAFNKIKMECQLHIIGGADSKAEKRYLKKYKKKFSRNSQIIWHGKVEKQDVDLLISNFDIMIHPTISMEVFGLNISESLSMGKPVIASRCGGAEMQIKDGVNGYLVEPNNILELYEVLQKCLTKNELNQSDIKNNNSIEQHVNKLIKLYEESIN